MSLKLTKRVYGAQRVDGLLRGFDERHVVHQIQANADVFAARGLDPIGQFAGTPRFVILDRERHFVLPQNRFRHLHALLTGVEKRVVFGGILELFVAPPGKRIVYANHAAVHLGGGLHGGLVLTQIGLGARRPQTHGKPHVVAVHLLPDLRHARGVQVVRQTRMRRAKPLAVAVFDDVPGFAFRLNPSAQAGSRGTHVLQYLRRRRGSGGNGGGSSRRGRGGEKSSAIHRIEPITFPARHAAMLLSMRTRGAKSRRAPGDTGVDEDRGRVYARNQLWDLQLDPEEGSRCDQRESIPAAIQAEEGQQTQ